MQVVHTLQTEPHQASAVVSRCFFRARRSKAHVWKRVQHRALRRRDERTAGHFCKVSQPASVAAGATSDETGQPTFARHLHAYAWERAGKD